MIITLFVLLSVLIIVISLFMGVFGVPYVPTPYKVIKKIDDQGIIREHAYILELGSGDARFLRYFHKKYTIKGIGYEISPMMFITSQFQVFFSNLKRKGKVKIKFKSYFDADFENADIIFFYLLPRTIKKMYPYFAKMKKGSTIISYDFQIKNFTPTKTIDIDDIKKVYVYKVK